MTTNPLAKRRVRRPHVVTFGALGIAAAVTYSIGGAACGPDESPLPPRAEAPDIETLDGGMPPCLDGGTIDCHVVIGKQGDVVTCLDGVKTCRNGAWSACEGSITESLEVPSDERPPPDCPLPGDDIFTTSSALSDPAYCTTNPCDPSCRYYHEAPVGGVKLEPHISGYYEEGTLEDAIAHSPQGFIDKGMKTPCATIADCQFDFHCVSGKCEPWNAGETISTCASPDLTTGFACTKDGTPTIPVCNRGNVTAPAGVKLFIFPGNSPQFPTCTPDNQPYQCSTKQALLPGACINVVGCPGLTGKGNKTIMVNPPRNPAQGPKNPDYIEECNCGNNWGDWSGSDTLCIEKPNYDTEPLVYSQIYQGACPEGSRVQWSYLTYLARTPADSNVVIQARVANNTADLAHAAIVDLAYAKATPLPDTQTCSLTGPAGCPIDLYDSLDGPPFVNNVYLELLFTLNPSSTKAEAPTLATWDVLYSCPWSE